jgi:hypothetical protein
MTDNKLHCVDAVLRNLPAARKTWGYHRGGGA